MPSEAKCGAGAEGRVGGLRSTSARMDPRPARRGAAREGLGRQLRPLAGSEPGSGQAVGRQRGLDLGDAQSCPAASPQQSPAFLVPLPTPFAGRVGCLPRRPPWEPAGSSSCSAWGWRGSGDTNGCRPLSAVRVAAGRPQALSRGAGPGHRPRESPLSGHPGQPRGAAGPDQPQDVTRCVPSLCWFGRARRPPHRWPC